MPEYDPLIEILESAAESCEQRSKANVLRNLQAVLRADSDLSKELQRRIVGVREGSRKNCINRSMQVWAHED